MNLTLEQLLALLSLMFLAGSFLIDLLKLILEMIKLPKERKKITASSYQTVAIILIITK